MAGTIACAVCGEPMQRQRTTLPEGQAMHRRCREAQCAPDKYLGRFTHGKGAYQKGCRCDLCREAKSAQLKRTREQAGRSTTSQRRR